MIELPFLNRRRMLLGLAAASAAAVPVAVSATPSASLQNVASTPSIPESPELVALGDKLPRAVKAYYASVRRLHRVRDRWTLEWPSAPKAAVADWYDRNAWETNIEGHEMLSDGSLYEFNFHAKPSDPPRPKPRTILASSYLEVRIRRLDRDLRRRRPKHPLTPDQVAALQQEIAALTNQVEVVRAYEYEKERVLKASGYAEVRAAYEAKRTQLLDLINDVMTEPAVTMEGVVIKAQAMAMLNDAHLRAWSLSYSLNGSWLTGFAASVLEIADQQSA